MAKVRKSGEKPKRKPRELPRCSCGIRAQHCKKHGKQYCPHGKKRVLCAEKECGGSGLCSHGHPRWRCKECGTGTSLCAKHGKLKQMCRECGGSGYCHHGKQKQRCKECSPQNFCAHGRRKNNYCKDCFPQTPARRAPARSCVHGKRKQDCTVCKARVSQACRFLAGAFRTIRQMFFKAMLKKKKNVQSGV